MSRRLQYQPSSPSPNPSPQSHRQNILGGSQPARSHRQGGLQLGEHTPGSSPGRSQSQGGTQLGEHTPEGSQSQEGLQLREHTPGGSQPEQSDRQMDAIDNNASDHGSMHTDGRIRVEVVLKVLEPSYKCSHIIREIMYERLERTGYNWKSVSNDTKKFNFEEFKKHVVWIQPDKIVYVAWARSAARRYSDLVCGAHVEWEKKGEKCNRIGEEIWVSWIAFSKTAEFKALSKVKKKNRCGGSDAPLPTHTGGSASHRTHAARMKNEMKKDPTPIDVFNRTHQRKDGEVWTNEKWKRISDTLKSIKENQATEMAQGLCSESIDDKRLYIEAVDIIAGPNEKNRVYGIGSSQDLFYGPGKKIGSTVCFYMNSQCQNEVHERMQEQLKAMYVGAVKGGAGAAATTNERYGEPNGNYP